MDLILSGFLDLAGLPRTRATFEDERRVQLRGEIDARSYADERSLLERLQRELAAHLLLLSDGNRSDPPSESSRGPKRTSAAAPSPRSSASLLDLPVLVLERITSFVETKADLRLSCKTLRPCVERTATSLTWSGTRERLRSSSWITEGPHAPLPHAIMHRCPQLSAIDCNQHSLFGDLHGCPSGLRSITCEHTSVSDLAPLGRCAALEQLGLRDTRVQNLAPCRSLVSLDASCTAVHDLAPLTACTGLQRINISNTYVTQLAPLAALPRLQALDARNTEITDLSFLTSHPGLLELQLGARWTEDDVLFPINSLSPLSCCRHLAKLALLSTAVSDLSPLAALTDLRELDFDVNDDTGSRGLVSDLQPLAGCTCLSKLTFRNNAVTSLAPLAALTALTYLDCSLNPLSDLEPLEACTQLQVLRVKDTDVESIEPLALMPGLRKLDINATHVWNLSPLGCCTGLQRLKLQMPDIYCLDLTPLAACKSLNCNISIARRPCDSCAQHWPSSSLFEEGRRQDEIDGGGWD